MSGVAGPGVNRRNAAIAAAVPGSRFPCQFCGVAARSPQTNTTVNWKTHKGEGIEPLDGSSDHEEAVMKWLIRGLVLLTLGLSGPRTQAVMISTAEFDDLVAKADGICIGRVVDKQAAWNDEETLIFTT